VVTGLALRQSRPGPELPDPGNEKPGRWNLAKGVSCGALGAKTEIPDEICESALGIQEEKNWFSVTADGPSVLLQSLEY